MTNEPMMVQTDLDGLSDYSLQLNRWLLKPIGAWPESSSTSKIERILSLVLNLICYCFIIFTIVPCIAQLLLEPQDARTKMKILGPMSHWFAGGINYTTLLLRGKEIRYCVNNIESDWRAVTKSKVQRVMLKNAKFGRSVAAFCAIFMHGGVLCHCVAMAFTMEIIQVGNETRTIHALPCAAYRKMIPVDTSPTNEIVLVVQFISGFIVNSTAVGAFSLAIVFASHAYGQLDVLMMWITEFVDESGELNKNVERNEIGVFVENHVKILSIISRIERIMSPICLSELCQCTLAMCFLCYFILTEWEGRDIQNLITYVLVLFSVTFNVFIMCYIGEKLSEQCNRIADAAYTTNWYYLPYKSVLDLVVIITRSSVVTKITAGKVVYMSVYTFGDVIKTAFTYLNILRQMKKIQDLQHPISHSYNYRDTHVTGNSVRRIKETSTAPTFLGASNCNSVGGYNCTCAKPKSFGNRCITVHVPCQLCVHFQLVDMIAPTSIPLKNDWMYSIQMNRWFLKPIGIWPLSLCLTTFEKINSVILTSISVFLIGFLLVPCALCTVLDKTGNLDTKIKMIGPLSFCVMAAIKYYILVSRGGKISKCIESIRLDWTRTRSIQCKEDREIIIENAKTGRSIAIFCAGFMYSGGFFYTTVMPLCTKRTEIIDNETVRSQAFPIYRGLLDPRSSPSFEIVQLMQCLAGFVIYSVTVGSCSLAAVFVMHACGQFKILIGKLKKLVDGISEKDELDTHERRLGDIVEHHLQILRFISEVEGLLNEICLVELVGCTMNICFLGYYLLMEWEQNETIGTMTYCTLLISFTFNIFILCYIGEILSEQYKKISLAAYMIDWYRLPERKALGLILVVAVSNSSIKLTAGKLVELSLSSFCSVLKSSLAYLSLLRTLTT